MKPPPLDLNELLAADAGLIGLTIAGRYWRKGLSGAQGVFCADDIRQVVLALQSKISSLEDALSDAKAALATAHMDYDR